MWYQVLRLAQDSNNICRAFVQLLSPVVSLLIAFALLFSSVNAQNATVIGAESFADNCFQASQVATSTGTASRADIELCDRAINEGGLRSDDLVATYVNRGVIYMAMRKPQLAMADLNRALELDDDTGEAYVNRGNLWFFGNNLRNAIADYDLALELGVEKPHVAHLNRGMAREQLGDLERAKVDYEASLRFAKGWSQAQLRLERVENKIQKKARERR